MPSSASIPWRLHHADSSPQRWVRGHQGAHRNGVLVAHSAVGIDRFSATLDQELDSVALGRGGFKAIRGDYGSGKTFFGRWGQERARTKGFVTSEVQISETETPLHRMETVYRRLCERLATADTLERALRHRAISIPLFATMPSRHCSDGLRGDARDTAEQ